jgi:hypothetical protein
MRIVSRGAMCIDLSTDPSCANGRQPVLACPKHEVRDEFRLRIWDAIGGGVVSASSKASEAHSVLRFDSSDDPKRVPLVPAHPWT